MATVVRTPRRTQQRPNPAPCPVIAAEESAAFCYDLTGLGALGLRAEHDRLLLGLAGGQRATPAVLARIAGISARLAREDG